MCRRYFLFFVLITSYSSILSFSILPESMLKEYQVETISNTMTPVDLAQYIINHHTITEEPFYIIDLGVLTRQYQQWVTLLNRVKPFYAIKCNPHPALVKTLAVLGVNFDCASQAEIEYIINLGIAANRIIFANPCKPISHLQRARELGIKRMTFDNVDELIKIQEICPEAELVLRILPDDSSSLMPFGSKFGAPAEIWTDLFSLAKELGLEIIGVSFHVGSNCMNIQAYVETLKRARAACDEGERHGFSMKLIDIGGGFPGNNGAITFAEIAQAINPILDELFDYTFEIIGEPGRYMAQETQILATCITGKKQNRQKFLDDDNVSYLYYTNDGVYGSFNCIFFDHVHPKPYVAEKNRKNLHPSKIFGPTCDSIDVICKNYPLPLLNIGDWLVFPSMGAYTSAAGSAFNGFKTTQYFYVYSE